jgi:5'-methylthioadenosine phosphorylase
MTAEIAVIGGSGFYRFLENSAEMSVDTPFGEPSGPFTLGEVGGRKVAFLARHGPGHHLSPHRINSRANVWALRELGVSRIVGPCACGSLRPGIGPGDIVVLDQLLDRTWGRDDSFLDGQPGRDSVEHISFADPYCPEIRKAVIDAAEAGAWPAEAIHTRGNVVVVQGPRFSTRAESRWYSSAGLDVINMTQYPEAYLARELGICYSGVALVTDRDAGVEGDPEIEPVTMEAAMAVLAANVEQTRGLLAEAIPRIPRTAGCACSAGGSETLRRRGAS